MSDMQYEYDRLVGQANLASALERQEFNLLALLKPSISIDGSQWCVLWGENPQDGVAGFGTTPYSAMLDFNKAWTRRLP